MSKKITIPVIIIAVIGLAVFLSQRSSQPSIEYTTQPAVKGHLKQTVDATGKIESADKIDLSFKITGQLSQILVDTGAQVTKGQKLAQLDSRTLATQVADANASLAQVQADLDKIIAGASSEDIQVSKNTVLQKEQAVVAAENNLSALLLLQDTELENLKDAAITSLRNEVITTQTALDEIDNTLRDSKVLVNLPAKDSYLLSDAQLNYSDAFTSLQADKNTSLLLSTNSSDVAVRSALDDLKNTISIVSTTLTQTLSVLNATLTSSALSETELEAYKDAIRAQQIKMNTASTNIQSVKSNWTNRIAYFEDQTKNAVDAVADAQTALQIAQAQLALKESPPRQFEIDAALARVDQARAALSRAQAQLSEAVITAPLDGTITKKNYEIGEQTSLATPVLEMIGQSKLQIEVDIPESDIAKVAIGQPVDVTLDAFGDDDIFAGSVTFIDPAETLIQDVVYYKVKVELAEGDERKKPGMTANVTIITDERDDALFVPTRAIKTENGQKFVETLENGQAVRKEVTTGLRGDLGTEILTGLTEGEKVITFVKEE